MHLNKADLFTLCIEIFHNLTGCFTDAAHGNHHTLGVRCTVIVEELIVTPGQGGHLLHISLHHIRECEIGRVAGLSVLEEHIVILTAVADGGMLRVQRPVAELQQFIVVQHFLQIRIVQHVNFLNFVGGAESVEEVLHRQMTLDGGEMGNCTQIHAFLHAGRCQLCPAGLPTRHHILMVTKDGHGFCCHATCCHMHHSRHQQTRNAVHRGDHQH